jgi:hypothetical protein
MADTKEIKQYQYYVFSSRDGYAKAVILLYGATELGATTLIGYVHLTGATEPLEAARQLPDGKYLLHYRYADLDDLVDMLRNEKPIYLLWVPEGTNNSRISTVAEAVGEGELP